MKTFHQRCKRFHRGENLFSAVERLHHRKIGCGSLLFYATLCVKYIFFYFNFL